MQFDLIYDEPHCRYLQNSVGLKYVKIGKTHEYCFAVIHNLFCGLSNRELSGSAALKSLPKPYRGQQIDRSPWNT
jgi:hypothetical protein